MQRNENDRITFRSRRAVLRDARQSRKDFAAPRSRKAHFDGPLCHQVIPFEIRRRRELCYSGVWADQRQIPGWDAYVRNWYAWWGFPSRIVNYHNLLAGREGDREMRLWFRVYRDCIHWGWRQFDFARNERRILASHAYLATTLIRFRWQYIPHVAHILPALRSSFN